MRSRVRFTGRGVALAVLLAATPAWAQRVSEPSLFAGITGSGARALGMAGAFTAIADDATAASWNPAGLCVLERPEASLVGQPYTGLTSSYPAYAYRGNTVTRGGTSTSTIVEQETGIPYDLAPTTRSLDFASFTFPFRAGRLKLVPQVSYQRIVNQALEYGFDSGYSEQYTQTLTNTAGATTYESVTTGGGSSTYRSDATGGIDVIAGSLGLSFDSKLYFGFTVNFWSNGPDAQAPYSMQSSSSYTGKSGTTPVSGGTDTTSSYQRTLSESYSGTNFQAGLLFKPSPKLSFGAVYKSAFDMDYTYSLVSPSTRTSNSTNLTGTSRSTTVQTIDSTTTVSQTGTVKWPQMLAGGIAFMPSDRLTFAFDASLLQFADTTLDYTGTQRTQQTSTRSVNGVPQTPTIIDRTLPTEGTRFWPTSGNPKNPETSNNKHQNDGLQLRLGVEYVVHQPRFLGLTALPIRAGVFRDRQLFKDTNLDPVYFNGLTAGLGFTWSRVSLDLAFVHTGGSYDADYSYSTSSSTQDYQYTTDYDENVKFSANRFFVSTTVRF